MSVVKISDSGGREVSVTNDNALKVDPSGTTQPVILTTGNNVIGQIKITDGNDVADILDLANSNPLAVAIVDASGDQITSFGGGTQYTEGDTDASITGNAVLMEVAGNALAPLQGTVADGLLVNLGSNNDVTVTSSALPTGAATAANQATIIGHVDGIEPLLTTIDADTSNISTKIDTIAGAVSGTEMQVDVLTMPTVNVSATDLDIRNLVFATDKVDISGSTLAANSGVDIGDVTINNAAGASAVNIQDGGNSITVDGTVSISGTVDTELPAAAALADNTANPTVPAVGAFGMVWDGANWDRIPGDQTDGVLVNLGANNDVTVTGSVTANAGTNLNTSALALEATLQSVKTAVETIDNAIAGSEMQVDIVAPIPVGTNYIGKTRLTDGVTDAEVVPLAGYNAQAVAIVDSSGNQISSFGGGTQYTEDAAADADPIGTMAMAVRADSLAAVTSTDGDNIALRSTNKGELYVKQTDVVPINDNGGSLTVDGTVTVTQATGTNLHTVVDSGTITTITNVVHVDDNGSTFSVDDGGGSITIDGSVSVSGAVDTELPAAAALADNTANPTVPAVGAFGMVWDGANWDRTPGNQTDGLLVNLGANNDVTVTGSVTANAGTNLNTSALALEATLQSVKTAVETIDNAIAGSEMQVDVVGSLPSGSNTIGNVKLTDGTDVADILDLPNSNPLTVAIVDASGDQITSFGGGTQYTEDVAAAADPVGTMSMAVRADSLAAVTSTDGDNIAIRATNKGEIYVKHVDSIPITDNGGSLTVDGIVTITPSGTQDINLSQVNGNAVNVGTGAAGTGTQRVTTSTDSTIGTVTTITNVVHVDDNAGSLTVDNAGTFAVQATLAAGATNIAKAEDDASANADVGVPAMAIRKATPANTSDTDGDYEMLQMSAGRVWASATIDAALPAGTNLIGKTGIDQTTPGTTNAVSLSHVGSTAVATGNGVVGTGVQRVAIASDNTAFSVNATLQAGTAAFGKLAANDGVDIGDVTINNASGASAVNIQDGGNSITVDNGGTFVVQENGAALTSLQLIDDTVFTDDTSTHSTGATKGLGMMAVANPTDANIDANDIGMLAMTLARALKTDLTTIAGTAVDTNSGNKSAGTQRMVVATDQPQLTTPLNVTIQAGATGGDSVYHLVSAATTNATNIKASAGKVTGWYIYNSNAAARKVAFHNTSGTPTAGSSVYFSLMIPPSSGANVSFPSGINFSSGIGITTVTGLADSDSAAVASNDLIINIYYV